jgi:ABC-type amino acid transport system permease subunit
MLDFFYATNRAPPALLRGATMTIDPVVISPLIALIAGILILLMPRLLNYVVAIYLIAIGIIGLANHFH